MAEKHEVAGSGSAMGMSSGIGRVIVGPEIGFGFYDAAGKEAGIGAVDQHLAQKTRGNQFRLRLKERSGQQRTAKDRIIQVPSGD
jgi:hypothetical protein